MNRKGSISLGLIVAIAVIGVLLIPGAVGSITSIFSSEPQPCDTAPYSSNCICGENERKIDVPWLGIPKWACENVEQLILDPESPTFEQDAIDFTQAYLSQHCGAVCSDLSCGDMSTCVQGNPTYPNEYCINAVYGYDSEGRRSVNIECIKVTEWDSSQRPMSGIIPWRMQFLVESETGQPVTYQVFMSDNYCYNEQTETKCAMPEYCEYYNNPDWCVGNLPLEIMPQQFSVFSVFQPRLGSGYPAPDGR